MAVTLPATPAAPPTTAPPPLARANMHAELTKLLVHGYGSLTVKVHDHRITSLETLTRWLRGQADEV